MKLGIYVGSFNPPHDGHYKVASYLVDNHIVDKVLLLPTPNYWHKQDLINVKDRVNMLKFYETDKIIVDNDHNNYVVTYKVLESLEKDYKKDKLYLIIGSDNLKDLDKWDKLDLILKHKIIVMNRGDLDYDIINKLGKKHFIVIDNFPFINISSTDIRNKKISHINKNVLKYIEDNNLYK